jgi:transposase
MVKAPTPEEEDRRRLCRERKVLIVERVRHVNRVKGLLFSQGISGYEPRCAATGGSGWIRSRPAMVAYYRII